MFIDSFEYDAYKQQAEMLQKGCLDCEKFDDYCKPQKVDHKLNKINKKIKKLCNPPWIMDTLRFTIDSMSRTNTYTHTINKNIIVMQTSECSKI